MMSAQSLHELRMRVAAIGRTLTDTQFESRDDELIEELGAELQTLSGICSVCHGEEADEDDPCPGCGGSGLERE